MWVKQNSRAKKEQGGGPVGGLNQFKGEQAARRGKLAGATGFDEIEEVRAGAGERDMGEVTMCRLTLGSRIPRKLKAARTSNLNPERQITTETYRMRRNRGRESFLGLEATSVVMSAVEGGSGLMTRCAVIAPCEVLPARRRERE